MEFFEWIGIPQSVLSLFAFDVSSVEEVLAIEMRTMVICLWVAAGIYLVGHLLGGFGLFRIAKRAGEKLAWMAFVPFLNTYLAGKIAGETSVFGIKCKRFGLYAAIAEFLYVALNVFVLVLSMLLLSRPEWHEFVYASDGVVVGTEYVTDAIPVGLRWMPTAELAVTIVADVLYFVMLFLFCVMFYAFFRKYYAKGPFIMTFLCSLLPFRGFVLFAVRNNAPVDYNAWMAERYRRYQAQQQQMYGRPPYNPPYNQPYNPPYNPPPASGEPPKDQPFGDLGDNKPDDNEPFSDL